VGVRRASGWDDRAARVSDTWIERVRAADAEAEEAWKYVDDFRVQPEMRSDRMTAITLIAIAAELRAQRIARRPGGGVT